MTNILLYGRNDFDFTPADNEDLRRTIYAYYCHNGYPDELQKSIDSATKLLEGGDVTAESEINDLLIMTGSLFQRILIQHSEGEDDK